MNENFKAIDCMAQHIKVFHQQHDSEVTADFGEPCQTCPHNNECNYNWLSVMEPLLTVSAIQITLVNREHSNKRDSDDNYLG